MAKWPPTRGSKGHFESPGWCFLATLQQLPLFIHTFSPEKPKTPPTRGAPPGGFYLLGGGGLPFVFDASQSVGVSPGYFLAPWSSWISPSEVTHPHFVLVFKLPEPKNRKDSFNKGVVCLEVSFTKTGKKSVPLVDSVMTWIRRNAMFELFSSPLTLQNWEKWRPWNPKDNCWKDGGKIPGKQIGSDTWDPRIYRNRLGKLTQPSSQRKGSFIFLGCWTS